MNILKFLFLIPFLVISQAGLAENDTLFTPSVRPGLDVSGLARHLMEPEVVTGEASLDVEWRKSHFVAIEGGLLQVDMQKETHRYQANGYFLRAGADFNILERNPENPHDVVLASIRYGYSKAEHEAPFIVISDPYWGDYETAVSKENFQAHWIEAGIGLKTEIWHNIFLGWSLRGKIMLASTDDPEMDPYFIGGFGKSGSNTRISLLYSIMYRIPMR